MWWVLLILLVALVGVFWKRQELGDKANPILAALVVIALVVAIMSLSRGRGRRQVKLEPDFYAAAGEKLGAAIAADIPGGGTVLVIHAGRMNDVYSKVAAAHIEGLKKGFGNVPFQVVEEGPRPEDEADTVILMEGALPLNVLQRYLAKVGEVAAVVSMVGAPEVVGRPPAGLPPIYLLGQVDPAMADELLRTGTIRGAVCYKDDADWKTPPRSDMSLDEIFNLRYVLLRPPR